MAENKKKKANINSLKKSIELIDENRRVFAEKLLCRAEFMEATLNKLEEQIKTDGAVITAINGNGFDVMSEHPAQKSYNVMIGKYNALIKTIIDMIPDIGQDDELLDFLGCGSK